MAAPTRIELPFRVRFDECGADGQARASAHLRWAQDVAWVHSAEAGFDRAWYADRGLAWLVRCLRLDITAPLGSGQKVSVSTEVVGWRRVWARRVSETRADPESGGDRPGGAGQPRGAPGRLIATVTTDWVLLGPTGAPARVPTDILDACATRLPSFEPGRLPRLTPPGSPPAWQTTFGVRRQELDPMGHVNHAVYLDWLEESVAAAGGQADLARLPRRYRLEYDRSAEPGTTVDATAWPTSPGAWAYRVADAAGLELLRAVLEPER